MKGNTKIERLAHLLVQKHGDEALAVVVERISWRLHVQDYAIAAMWAQVAEAVRELLPEAKSDRSRRRRQAPLEELMNDPVMYAVVQDNEEHRREIYNTLSTAKRRLRHSDS